jgi:hypothetical protein
MAGGATRGDVETVRIVIHRRVALGRCCVGHDVRARRDEGVAEFDVVGVRRVVKTIGMCRMSPRCRSRSPLPDRCDVGFSHNLGRCSHQRIPSCGPHLRYLAVQRHCLCLGTARSLRGGLQSCCPNF